MHLIMALLAMVMEVTFVGFDNCIDGVGGIVMIGVLMTAVVIAANVIISNLNNCMLVGGICVSEVSV